MADNRGSKRQLASGLQTNATQEKPQVAFMIHTEVMDHMDGPSKAYLQSMFGSILWDKFCDYQIEQKQKEVMELSPGSFSPENYTQLSSDLRLVWRLWKDLKEFGKQYKPER